MSQKILVVGDTSEDTNTRCSEIASRTGIPFKGMISSKDLIEDRGCYHVSVGDTSFEFVESIISMVDEVIFLDQGDMSTELLKNSYQSDVRLNTLSDEDMLFVGCSHTMGADFPDITYPTPFGKISKYNIVNRGLGGTSNYRIEDVLAEYDLRKKNVIIQFTDPMRIRYYDHSLGEVVHKLGRDYSREEVMLYDVPRMNYEFKKILDRVVARLRDADSRFLFFYLGFHNESTDELDLYMSRYKEFCLVKDYDIDRATDGGHQGPRSHELIAKKLYKKWIRMYGKKTKSN